MRQTTELQGKTALVTGGAARLGASIVRHLHAAGARVVIHYRKSAGSAAALRDELLAIRGKSATTAQADLNDPLSWPRLINDTLGFAGGLDILINNASSYYPTPLDEATTEHWDDLFGSNARAPFFLAQRQNCARPKAVSSISSTSTPSGRMQITRCTAWQKRPTR